MGQDSKIEWCDHTFNPWTGCQKVSPACDSCYAESWAKRSGLVKWGAGEARRRTSDAYWRQPIKWNSDAERDGARRKVFCASLADVFDNQVLREWRDGLWILIESTPHLDWLLLTKRPQNIKKMLPAPGDPRVWGGGWPNVWIGTTVENQEEADRRIPHLLAVPAAKRFLSCEPLLGPVDLRRFISQGWGSDSPTPSEIDWVICGGESGPHARPSHPDWVKSLRDQCAANDVAFFFKQWGQWGPEDPARKTLPHAVANDGTLYRQADLAFPDGARYGEAIRANHDKAHLTSVYPVGKKLAGALLDGAEHRAVPG